MKKILTVLLITISFLGGNFFAFKPKIVSADACNSTAQIVAGTSNSITLYGFNTVSSPYCVVGLISDGYGITFDSVFTETVFCSNGAQQQRFVTQNYNATALNSNTAQQTLYLTAEILIDTGGECQTLQSIIEVSLVPGSAPADFTISCSPATNSIQAGSTTSYSLSTTPSNGFNSAVNFTHSISGAGTQPTVSYTNNGAVPAATTTAVINTSFSTSPGTYTITFTGTGGSISKNCSVQVQVTAAPRGFSFTITPNDANVLQPNSQSYTVTANCTGALTGPVTNLTATSGFSAVTYSFSNTSVACAGSVTLTVNNTAAVPAGQLSTPQTRQPQSLVVNGESN